MVSEGSAHRVHWLIKVFVAFHLVAVVTWALPPPPARVLQEGAEFQPRDAANYFLKANNALKGPPFREYLFFTGQWQSWDMFAPDPINMDLWLDAIVTYSDGAKLRYEYPRMATLGYGDRYLMERYRKFFENVNSPAHIYALPELAQGIAFKCDTNPGNPPVQVSLVRHWRTVSAPGSPQGQEYLSGTIYVHAVDQARLSLRRGK